MSGEAIQRLVWMLNSGIVKDARAHNRLSGAVQDALAEAWSEGLGAAYGHVAKCEDADAAGQGVLIPDPVNPYLEAS